MPKLNSFFGNIALNEATGCWNWTGARDKDGYGKMRFRGSHRRVHSISAEIYLGFERRAGLMVCHRCDNPSCFNPKHLFIGTMSANALDSVAKGRNPIKNRTHCPRGHVYDFANTLVSKKGWRQCRACADTWSKRKRQRLDGLRVTWTGGVFTPETERCVAK